MFGIKIGVCLFRCDHMVTFPNHVAPCFAFGTFTKSFARWHAHLSFCNFWIEKKNMIEFRMIFVFRS
jgi:hypothetical protein